MEVNKSRTEGVKNLKILEQDVASEIWMIMYAIMYQIYRRSVYDAY